MAREGGDREREEYTEGGRRYRGMKEGTERGKEGE